MTVRCEAWLSAERIDSDTDDMMDKSLMETSTTPSYDIWRKFSLPITPPSSPIRSYGECSDSDEMVSDSCEIAERLHDVCESLDATFDASSNVAKLADALTLRSKLISDCMWSGNNPCEIARYLLTAAQSQKNDKKLTIEPEIDLYPTPCPSPLPPTVSEGTDCPSSSECVDPTTVFPCSLSSPEVMNSSLSDTSDDEEIDVVTVDVKPLTIVVGTKRKLPVLSTPSSIPIFKRAKSSPAKLQQHQSIERTYSLRKVSNADDSDPETRRATHNVLERKRRIDLKKSFERLRDCVPHLEKQDKAPKVVVLKRASQHISQLTRDEKDLAEQKRLLQKEKLDLVSRLKQLLRDREITF